MRLLQSAIEAELAARLTSYEGLRDERGRQRIVRNGHLPRRTVLTGAGPLEVRQPRLRDRVAARGSEDRIRFQSAILPRYLRRSPTIEGLIPWLYLKGISTGDMQEALEALLGEGARGLSAKVVVQLKEEWLREFEAWSKRDLSRKEYVYIWADGIYVNVRLEEDGRQCLLVLMGATREGFKELIAVQDGYRESEQSWHEVLTDLKARGLNIPPKLAVGDGALGFWAALRKAWPETREQRCWVHKTANILNKLPRGLHTRAKEDLHQVSMAPTRTAAEAACLRFIAKYKPKYPKAADCLAKDQDELLAFYAFPAEHWKHVRTTNPIESTFATVRLRHRRTKGSGNRNASLAMVFKLIQNAEGHWRRLDGHQYIIDVLAGRPFQDGIIDLNQRDAA